MDQADDLDLVEGLGTTDLELQRLIGTFDAPAFARRGQDLERSLAIFDSRCRQARLSLLTMVHLRLRQWAEVATSFHDYPEQLTRPLQSVFEQALAPRPRWAAVPGTSWRRALAAGNLAASITRFNRRWVAHVGQLDLAPINRIIHQYNAYYTLEKECCLGSTRLATQHFSTVEPVSVASILRVHPPIDEINPRHP